MQVKKTSLAQGLGLIWSTEGGKKAILGVHSEQGVCPALICGQLRGLLCTVSHSCPLLPEFQPTWSSGDNCGVLCAN